MTILEVLAQAGDMTIYGKQDNVKLLRELPDGTYEVYGFNMAQNSKVGTTTRLWLNGASITISIGSILYRVLQ